MYSYNNGPAPHGAGGLKLVDHAYFGGDKPVSRPAWGGWIEIPALSTMPSSSPSPAPHGAGGLKC